LVVDTNLKKNPTRPLTGVSGEVPEKDLTGPTLFRDFRFAG